jgi:hypothetical protein
MSSLAVCDTNGRYVPDLPPRCEEQQSAAERFSREVQRAIQREV